jgi:purine-binding chemotaxis protein CheW
VLELAAEQIRPAPEFNGAVDASFITGLGSVKSSESEQGCDRMLILVDIETLMAGADMGLVDAVHA